MTVMSTKLEVRKFSVKTQGSWRGFPLNRYILSLTIAFAISGCIGQKSWHLEEVTGHLPDLDFSLISDRGIPVTAKTYEGYLLLMYFGFTHCNAECPVSMARLAHVMRLLGNDAERTRILFVTLDPQRDTPQTLHRYITQFDAEHAVGLTGTVADIERLTKQYRAAYRPRSKIEEVGDIEHGDAVYIFDAKGQARLLATSSDPSERLAEDLKRLIKVSSFSGLAP
jgi:protein SCO1